MSLHYFDSEFVQMAKEQLPPQQMLRFIKPKYFLRLAAQVKNEKGYSDEKYERVKGLIKDDIKFPNLPYLRLHYYYDVTPQFDEVLVRNTLQVIGHEGRHRTRHLMEKGFLYTPVILIYNMEPEIPKYVRDQDDTTTLSWSRVFITPEEYFQLENK